MPSIKKIHLFIFFFISLIKITAQDEGIAFKIMYGKNELTLNDSIYNSKTLGKIIITNLKFYISGICFLNNDSIVKKTEDAYIIDLNKTQSKYIAIAGIKNLKYNQMKFNVGVDSATSNAGALGGSLDPSLGMYWTWQSGYINIKLEGTCFSCNSKKKDFQYHLGGFMQPYYTLQSQTILTNKSNSVLNINLEKFFNNLPINMPTHIMSPCENAIVASKLFANCISEVK